METPEYLKNTSNELNQRYNIIIDEIVKTYPSYKTNQSFSSYEDSYKANISNLEKLQKDFFLLKNDLNKNINILQQDINQIDETIYKIEIENKKLHDELELLLNSDNGSHGRLIDSKTLYNQQLTGNWLIFILTSSLFYVYYRRMYS